MDNPHLSSSSPSESDREPLRKLLDAPAQGMQGSGFHFQVMGTLVIATIMLSTLLTFTLTWRAMREMDAAAERLMQTISETLAHKLSTSRVDSSPLVSQLLQAAMSSANLVYLGVYDTHGRLTAESGYVTPAWQFKTPGETGARCETIINKGERAWQVVTPIKDARSVPTDTPMQGYLHAVFQVDDLEQSKTSLIAHNTLYAAGFAAAFTFVIVVMTRRLTAPMQQRALQLISQSKISDSENKELAALLKNNRELIRSMHAVVERERHEISREIHDQLGAKLVKTKLEMHASRKIAGDLPSAALTDALVEHQDAAIELVDEVYEMSRDILQKLRPDIIDTLGLHDGIQDYIESWARSMRGCQYRYDTKGDINSISDEITMAVYRIVQESLTNVAKHSAATRVEVEIMRVTQKGQRDVVGVTIKDNGVGFDTEQKVSGMGLIGIRERVFALSGNVEVKSTPGNGATITAYIPLRQSPA